MSVNKERYTLSEKREKKDVEGEKRRDNETVENEMKAKAKSFVNCKKDNK